MTFVEISCKKIRTEKCRWDQGSTDVTGNFKFLLVKRNENRILAYYFHTRGNPMTMRESKVFEKRDVMMLQLGIRVMNRSRTAIQPGPQKHRNFLAKFYVKLVKIF